MKCVVPKDPKLIIPATLRSATLPQGSIFRRSGSDSGSSSSRSDSGSLKSSRSGNGSIDSNSKLSISKSPSVKRSSSSSSSSSASSSSANETGENSQTFLFEKAHVLPKREGFVPLVESCSDGGYSEIERSLDYNKLYESLSSEKTLSYSLHNNFRCIIQSIITRPHSRYFEDEKHPNRMFHLEDDPNYPGSNIGDWIEESRLIGGESAFGYALLVTPKSKNKQIKNKPIVVIKTVRDVNEDDLPHEAFIGLYCVNKFRKILPNFMFTYGYTMCEEYEPSKKRRVCTSSELGNVSHLILENVMNSTTLLDFLDNSFTSDDIEYLDLVKIFAQLFGALALAQRMFEFEHQDLHLSNVLVRDFEEEIHVPIYFGNEDDENDDNDSEYGIIRTRYVPYIIDFGLSKVTVQGVTFNPIHGVPEKGDEKFLVREFAKSILRGIKRLGFTDKIEEMKDFSEVLSLRYRPIEYTKEILFDEQQVEPYRDIINENDNVYNSCLFDLEFSQ